MDESTHENAMTRLCFVCGQMIDLKRVVYDVEKHRDMLSRTLRENVMTVPGVTPPRFCYKCFCGLRKLDCGKILNVESRRLISWKECGPSCESCAMLKRSQAGGRKKKVCMLLCDQPLHFFIRKLSTHMALNVS